MFLWGPRPQISFNESNPTNASSITVTVDFVGANSPITQVQADNVTISGIPYPSWMKINSYRYICVIATTDGAESDYTVNVPGGLYSGILFGSRTATETITCDRAAPRPTVSFSEQDPTSAATITVTVDFVDAFASITQFQADSVTISGVDYPSWTKVTDYRYIYVIATEDGVETDYTVNVSGGLYSDGLQGNINVTETITCDRVG
jgi:hypothetical protein